MNNLRNRSSVLFVAAAIFFSLVSLANAQNRNDRDIRDAVRSLNSRLDDFEQTARFQMQSSSQNSSDVSDLMAEIRNLRDRVRDFQQNYDRKRENRDDINRIVDSARSINAFLQRESQNRRVQDDWTAVRRQIDRLGTNYGV